MLEHVIVWAIVGIAVFYIARTIYFGIKNKNGCGGACNMCGSKERR